MIKKTNNTCPCCGYKVFDEEQGSYDICPICFWEEDLVQLEFPYYAGGANKVSLYEGQKNFLEFGACENTMIQHVRKPNDFEEKDETWRPLFYADAVRKELVVIDLSDVNTTSDLHKKLKIELGFPDFYGMNWDAFWDGITGLVELPETIEFRDSFRVERLLQRDFRIMREQFIALIDEYPHWGCTVLYK